MRNMQTINLPNKIQAGLKELYMQIACAKANISFDEVDNSDLRSIVFEEALLQACNYIAYHLNPENL